MTQTDNIGDWSRGEKYTLRHRVRLLLGIHGQMQGGEYLFDLPPSWKYPRLNKALNRLINFIPVSREEVHKAQ